MRLDKEIAIYNEVEFTCECCGRNWIKGYESPYNKDICVFCDTDGDYESDYEYDDEDYG